MGNQRPEIHIKRLFAVFADEGDRIIDEEPR
jgi:hypothetical protein